MHAVTHESMFATSKVTDVSQLELSALEEHHLFAAVEQCHYDISCKSPKEHCYSSRHRFVQDALLPSSHPQA